MSGRAPGSWIAPARRALERWRLRRRLAVELRHHRRLRMAELRGAGSSWWRAWRLTRRGAAARAALYAACERIWLGAPEAGAQRRIWRERLRARGVLPALLAAAAMVLLWAGPRHPLVRYSLLRRLPWPGAATLYVNAQQRFNGGRVGVPNVEPCAAAFRFERAIWESPRGQMPVSALQATPALWADFGLPATAPGEVWVAPGFPRTRRGGADWVELDYRWWRVAGTLPAAQRELFSPARVWMPLPADPGLLVLRLDPHPLDVAASPPVEWLMPYHMPLTECLLADLSYSRWGMVALPALCLLLALGDLARVARAGGGRGVVAVRLAHAASYWAYALLTAAALALLLAAASGCMVYAWPALGLAGGVVTLLAWLLAGLALLRWCREDHRYRCRTCLRRLRLPRPEGEWGAVLLSAPTCEYICVHGHGRLVVPARACQMHPLECWSCAGAWWHELISAPRSAA